MGNNIWLFLYMLDHADWETGVVRNFTDASYAEEFEVSPHTVRYQRRKLQEMGYITCKQSLRRQEITIHNWVDPRKYSGEVLNTPPDVGGTSKSHDDNELPPLENEGENELHGGNHGGSHGGSHGIDEITAPTLDSHITHHISKDSIEDEHRKRLLAIFEKLRGTISIDWLIMSGALGNPDFKFEYVVDVGYFPEDIREYVRLLCELWSIDPPANKSSQYKNWIKMGRELVDACAEFEHYLIYAVYANIGHNQKVTISRPTGLIQYCRSMAGKLRKKKITKDDLRGDVKPSARTVVKITGKGEEVL
jgi:hypothetical protein